MSDAGSDSPPRLPGNTRAGRTFRRHLFLFCVGNGALTAANVYTGAPWWAFWPLVVWGLVLMVHFLFYRASTVDDVWVEERTQDLRSKSYDYAHIDNIREQAEISAGHRQNATPSGTATRPPRGKDGT